MSEDELAFYVALETNDSAVQVHGGDELLHHRLRVGDQNEGGLASNGASLLVSDAQISS